MREADLAPVTTELAAQVDFFIGKAQLADLLGVKPSSLYRIEQRGGCPPSFRWDGKRRWSLREVLAFMREIKACREQVKPLKPLRRVKMLQEARAHAPRRPRPLRFAH